MVLSAAFSPDGLTDSWGRDSGEGLLTLQVQGDMVTPAAFWPDGR